MRLLGFLALSTLALSSTSSMAAENADNQKKGPTRTVCRSEPVIGSRLKTERRCATAAEWDEVKRSERLIVERTQNQRAINSN